MMDKVPESVNDYLIQYREQINSSLLSINSAVLKWVSLTLYEAIIKNKTVYVCGNGGSAAVSEHFVCDHLKGISSDTNLKPRFVSLSSNIPLLTALGNDLGYENIFSKQIEYMAQEGDVLLAISSSGNSPNIVNAIKAGNNKKLITISFTGFDGGQASKLSLFNLHTPVKNYGIVEDTHQIVMHVLAQYIRLSYHHKNSELKL